MMRSMLKTYAAPFAGMSFFWVYVRYQSFFGLLYPLSFEGRLSGLAPYPVLLALLFALCMAVVATRARIEGVFRLRRILVPIVCGLGSVGVALGFGVDEGMLASWVSWVSLLFVAVAFVTGYLAWSIWFCDRFDLGHIVVLAASYMTSLLIFHAWVRVRSNSCSCVYGPVLVRRFSSLCGISEYGILDAAEGDALRCSVRRIPRGGERAEGYRRHVRSRPYRSDVSVAAFRCIVGDPARVLRSVCTKAEARNGGRVERERREVLSSDRGHDVEGVGGACAFVLRGHLRGAARRSLRAVGACRGRGAIDVRRASLGDALQSRACREAFPGARVYRFQHSHERRLVAAQLRGAAQLADPGGWERSHAGYGRRGSACRVRFAGIYHFGVRCCGAEEARRREPRRDGGFESFDAFCFGGLGAIVQADVARDRGGNAVRSGP